jgi:hypothetical protein
VLKVLRVLKGLTVRGAKGAKGTKVQDMKLKSICVGAAAALVLAATAVPSARLALSERSESNGQATASTDRLTAEVLKGLEFRSIGPAISTGRVQDIAIDPKSPNTWYVATAFGGLWKTTNRGTTFTPVFDNGGSFTLCCVVVDPKNSDVVWLGTGENASQRSAHFGDGIYKSTDAGKTWQRMGLAASEHLGQILIDPRNSNVVYVAAQGPLWSAGGDRGLYKTTDGGARWERVLKVSEDTGISDIGVRSEEPRHPLRVVLSAPPRRRPDDRRRAGRRDLEDDGRGEEVDEALEGPSEG